MLQMYVRTDGRNYKFTDKNCMLMGIDFFSFNPVS